MKIDQHSGKAAQRMILGKLLPMPSHQNETIHLLKFSIDSDLLSVFINDEDAEIQNMTASWKDTPRTGSVLDTVELCFQKTY